MKTKTNIKPGYKQTKLGLIPEDWIINELGEISVVKDGTHDSPKYVKNGYPMITSKNLNSNGKLDFNNVSFLTQEDFDNINKRSKVDIGDIIFGMIGTLGNPVILKSDNFAIKNVALIKEKEELKNNFLIHFLESNIIQKQFYRVNAGGTQKFLALGVIRKLQIPIPPLPEQEKIAAILSTWDISIEKTQKLLEKLQARKKGLMQQLLTGKKRLKGFSGEWEEMKGIKLFKSISNKSHNGAFQVLSATQDKGVIPRSEVGIDIKYDKSSLKNYKKVEIGNFVISLRSFQGGIEYSEHEGIISPAYTILEEILPIAKKFYMEYMKTETFINKLNSIIYGIRDGKQISFKEFSSLKFLYPNLEEQKAIAAVLNQADEEIKYYENYLEKLEAQKKGLMQVLLTGALRVNAPSPRGEYASQNARR